MGLSNDDRYPRDAIAPHRVDHFFEWGDRADEGPAGYWGYEYNYIVYEFREGAATAIVWAYCDEASTAILRKIEPDDLRSDFAARVLVFMSMRYEKVERMTAHGRCSLPADVVEKVETLKSRHMREHGQ